MDAAALAAERLAAALEDPDWPGKVRLLERGEDRTLLRRLSAEAGVPLVIVRVHIAAGAWDETITPLE